MPRDCGECTACCYFMNINEVNSPVNEKCQHCNDGCTIYDSRPTACAEFKCLWLGQEQMPNSLRPDKVNVMFELPFNCNTYIGYTNVTDWDTPEVRVLISKINQAGNAVVIKDKDNNKIYSLAPGQTREDMHNDINNAIRSL